jgi:hypothetical protein
MRLGLHQGNVHTDRWVHFFDSKPVPQSHLRAIHFIGEECYGMLENSRIQDIQNGVRDLSHTCRNREELDVLMIPNDF